MGEELIEVSRLESAEADLRNWQDRAYDAELRVEKLQHDLECALDAAETAESRENAAYQRVQDTEQELEEVHENYHDLEVEYDRRAYERDCYKAVLEGMEFIEIDTYPEKGHEFCRRLGIEAKQIMERVINNSLEKR